MFQRSDEQENPLRALALSLAALLFSLGFTVSTIQVGLVCRVLRVCTMGTTRVSIYRFTGGHLQFILNGIVARVATYSNVKLHMALLPFLTYVFVFVLVSILWVRTTRRRRKVCGGGARVMPAAACMCAT